uniref:Ribosome maturation protein SBDS n=1 Tax=Schistocephalus solidus TaxID=70667 RepID=A0A0X3NMV4_SCHSO
MSIFTPINQKRLTNVSVVRLKKNGNRYEIACYPNKVHAWRENLEKNIDEVLQTQEIFSNVSKGQLATKSDIFRDFDTDDINAVLLQILNDGEIQFTGKERKMENQNMYRDVAKIVSEKCINLETNRAFTVTMIEKMMKDCHINLQPKKSAKQQALEVIKQLRAVEGFKIAPSMMEILISLDPKLVDALSPNVLKLVHQIIRQERNSEGIFELAAIIEPDNYHALLNMLEEQAKNRFCIEIIGPAWPGDTTRGRQAAARSKQLKKTHDSIPESVPESVSPRTLPDVTENSAELVQPVSASVDDLLVTSPSSIQESKKAAGNDFEDDDYDSFAGRRAARQNKRKGRKKAAAAAASAV